MIKEDYVNFEVAKLLKEKGFPQDYDRYHALVYNEKDYEDEYEVQRMVLETRQVKAGTLHSYPLGVPEPKCYCPTQSLALKWLREVHNLHIFAKPYWPQGDMRNKMNWQGFVIDLNTIDRDNQCYANSPEEAIEAALLYVLKNLI